MGEIRNVYGFEKDARAYAVHKTRIKNSQRCPLRLPGMYRPLSLSYIELLQRSGRMKYSPRANTSSAENKFEDRVIADDLCSLFVDTVLLFKDLTVYRANGVS